MGEGINDPPARVELRNDPVLAAMMEVTATMMGTSARYNLHWL
jgi:hypothetical protein